jgi:dephospho-CoA kinase
LILDAPTLFESGHKDFCDRILFVTASLSRREAWALKERGWSAEELVRRDAHLIVESEKRALADAVVSNDGTRKKLDEQAAHLWRLWVQ